MISYYGVIKELKNNPAVSVDSVNLGLFETSCVAPDTEVELFQTFQNTNHSFPSSPAVWRAFLIKVDAK